MNLIQKESDLSKMRCTIPNKHLILIKLCKKDTEVSLLDDPCPCIVFFKGPRWRWHHCALRFPRLYAIYIIPLLTPNTIHTITLLLNIL